MHPVAIWVAAGLSKCHISLHFEIFTVRKVFSPARYF